ncbi:hypothetical protein [Kaistia nematophila]|uniref:Uncharacterized protein n=1 Tax=Kaistia nematophila TaxID=2994654 RepID=A0A9X3E2U4_9HYPH|nr:hypothetical protein [Kaistia nematophila]MCX5569617.1 hypothetical protein [Kaistia nematophila]
MFRRSFMSLGLSALALAFAGGAAASVVTPPQMVRGLPSVAQVTPTRRRWLPKSGARYAANGKRECARRRAQIAAGQLTTANGLTA